MWFKKIFKTNETQDTTCKTIEQPEENKEARITPSNVFQLLEDNNNIKFLDSNWKQNMTEEELKEKELIEKLWNAAVFNQRFLNKMYINYSNWEYEHIHIDDFVHNIVEFNTFMVAFSIWYYRHPNIMEFVFDHVETNKRKQIDDIITNNVNNLSDEELFEKAEHLTLFEDTLNHLINHFKDDDSIKIPSWANPTEREIAQIIHLVSNGYDKFINHYNNIGISLDNCDSFNKALKYIKEAEEAINSYMVKEL